MMFWHVGRVSLTTLFIKELADPLKHQAYATAMSSFIVIEARLNSSSEIIEQVIFDPSGLRLDAVIDADVIPMYDIIFTKSKPVTVFDNPYCAELRRKPPGSIIDRFEAGDFALREQLGKKS